jgi:tetratricopeptide (TPR) repeat protein
VIVTDLPSRKIGGLNQQTYQRLKLALSLGLRRQIFIAVCDDLLLRDRLAVQLEAELIQLASAQASQQKRTDASEPVTAWRRYPRLVSLHLNASDPNPLAQMARWLTQFPPPQMGNRRALMPGFQLLGIELLTRQPAAIQRLFFTHLQGIERSLPILESSLLLWMPQPWFRALPQSAPEFWRCRTGVFEFVGDPTPSVAPVDDNSDRPAHHPPASPQGQSRNVIHLETAKSQVAAKPVVTPRQTVPTQTDTWDDLFDDLEKLDELYPEEPAQPNGDRPTAPPASQPTEQPVARQFVEPAEVPPDEPELTQPPTQELSDRQAASPRQPVTAELAETEAESETAAIESTAIAENANLQTAGAQQMSLLQQIELLQQQKAPPSILANAYRTLGNLYRDRIEQGDVSPQNIAVAIESYEQALVWLHESSPLWVDILNDLGNLYWMLARSATTLEQALTSLRQAIQSYQTAIDKINPQTQSQLFAMVQNNVGAAYADLARYEEPAENLQRSIQAYQQALRHRKAEDEPQRYASTQNNLGTTYWNLAQHQQPVVHLKQAIGAYSEALRYYNPEQEPLNYAMIQNNLGTAYWNLAQHEQPKDWLMLALGAYRMALRYRTQESAPSAFAATQNNLGTAYWHLANHSKDKPEERLDYLQQAIAAYEAALNTATDLAQQQTGMQTAPLGFDVFATHNNLGLAHFQVATDPRISLKNDAQSNHLQTALRHHVQALEGWQQRSDYRQTALNCVIQTIRAFYSQCGIAGQSLALSSIPGHLLPEVLPQL